MHVLKQAALFIRTNLWIVPVALLLVWALFRFLDPAPPRTLVMATGSESGGYHQFGLALKQRLATEGLTLELQTSKGSVDNLRRLTASQSPVQMGLIQSGITTQVDPTSLSGLASLGAIYHEPLWLFKRRDAGVEQLADVPGQRVGVGNVGSGTWAVVGNLFEQFGLAPDEQLVSGSWQQLTDSAAAQALQNGQLDAAFFVLPEGNAIVRRLLSDPELELVSMGQADALAARLPFLDALDVPQGLFDLSRNIPPQPLRMVSPVAVLIINEGFHPALASLVLEAARDVLSQGSLLDPAGAFPAAAPSELPLSSEAKYYYESGVPLLQRYLPFWIASIVDRYVVLLIPFIAIMLPLLKSMGPLYAWRMRARVYRWYAQLRRVDKLIHTGLIHQVLAQEVNELLKLEDELTQVDVPLSYAHELYSLHLHVGYMITRLRQMQNADDNPAAPTE